MHYASVEQISKSFGIRTLFQRISFHIEEGDKIALVARNGTGKSTLLKILAGKEQADEGTVWVHKDARVVYLPQESEFNPELSILDQLFQLDHPVIQVVKQYEHFLESGSADADLLGQILSRMDELQAWNLESAVKQVLGKLQLHQPEAKMGQLSGGQRKRVALAQALLEARWYEGRCLLIMDEPTNHLDVGMIEWLEEYLSAQKVTLFMVTHDRYFLDAVCNEIIEIDEGKVFLYQGNYDYFLEQKSLRHDVQQSELQKDKNIYRKELEWMRKQPKARTTKSKSRQDAFVDLEDKVKQQRSTQSFNLQMKMNRLGGKVLEMKKVYKRYGDKIILKGFDYTFKKGERIGVVGNNGVGKSSFIKIALQLEEPDSGKINHGETVVFGYYGQEGLPYKEDKRAIEYVKELAEFFPLSDGSKISAAQFMERFGFPPEQQFTLLSKLSGGEKRRLHLLSILFRNPNFLVLDEPTNDLDLPTLRTLEEFLMDFPGCILIVSHDRYFMDRLVDHLFVLEGAGDVRDYPGNYTLYREEQDAVKPVAVKADPKPAAEEIKQAVTETNNRKLSFKEKYEFEQLEKTLPLLETEKRNLEAKMAGNLPYDELQAAANRMGEILAELETKEMRWLELSELQGK